MLNKTIHNYRKIILKNNDSTGADKEGIFKLLSYLNMLINIKNKINTSDRIYNAGYHRKLIEKEPAFALKNWLIEKFDEIMVTGKLTQKIKS